MGFLRLVMALLLGASPGQAPGNVDQAKIEEAIRRGVAWLYEQQKPDGSWENASSRQKSDRGNDSSGPQWGGRTALAVYALLASGQDPRDPRLEKAIQWMLKAELVGTYALSMRCMALSFLPATAENRKHLARDASVLVSMMKSEGRASGHFDYVASGRSGTYSHSRSQYGVLGVWAAASLGAEVPQEFWSMVEKGWVRNQHRSGAWGYMHTDDTKYPLSIGMTAAGVATLYLADEFLRAPQFAECRGNRTSHPVDAAMKWISENFDQCTPSEPYPRDFPYATLYAIERIGVASGLRKIAGRDWYRVGAEWILSRQRRDGSWASPPRSAIRDELAPLPDTCFALLFLARGRSPVIVGKLDYNDPSATPGKSPPPAWNQRPHDLSRLVRWMGEKIERELHWEVVSLADANAAELADIPVLLLMGNRAIALSDKGKATLRQYVHHGGLLVGHADCGKREFSDSFVKLGKELFPEYEFRNLPADHVAYTQQPFPRTGWREKPVVLGMSNGARELLILLPNSDYSRIWQLNDRRRPEPWELPTNLFLYAADRARLRWRGERASELLTKAPEGLATSLSVARIRYSGNWNPEPAAWDRFAVGLASQDRIQLRAEEVEFDRLDSRFKVAHLTGTDPIRLDSAAKTALAQFVESGGVLLVDAAGGSAAFADAAESEILDALPGTRFELLSEDDPLLGSATGALRVDYRNHAIRELGMKPKSPPIKVIRRGDRVAVVFSRLDLTCGLAGVPHDGIIGYTPASSMELVRRVLVNATGAARRSAESSN
jgi:hypothetical protein